MVMHTSEVDRTIFSSLEAGGVERLADEIILAVGDHTVFVASPELHDNYQRQLGNLIAILSQEYNRVSRMTKQELDEAGLTPLEQDR